MDALAKINGEKTFLQRFARCAGMWILILIGTFILVSIAIPTKTKIKKEAKR